MSESTNNPEYWKKIKDKFPKSKLIFIHTPKCGGTYVITILKKLGIKNKGHVQATKQDSITFTVIREPVARFESLLNFRLGEKRPRHDWPRQLRGAYHNKSITLNQIVNKMRPLQIKRFYPYQSLVYWSKNIHIFITIDKLQDFLRFFGYSYHPDEFKKQNVSKKVRGTLNDKSIKKLEKIFAKDIELYKKVI